MSSPPPGAQVSGDGKWWWDGTRWVAMPQEQMVSQPPGPPAQAVPPGAPMQTYAAGPRTNSMAVASLVAGIAAWVICPLLGAILAIIFGFIARGQIKTTGEAGSGLALAGLILGFAHLALSALALIVAIVVFGGLAAMLAVIANLPTPTPSP
ncbi:MAG TPA: DUF4190 domain-containing protein [Candidatus Dormibacteraeota bacterium]|nr:DUF4190 domain-containing protein [Candidatus Dormibacteraeota bacterium]